jgi:hypothetical protein
MSRREVPHQIPFSLLFLFPSSSLPLPFFFSPSPQTDLCVQVYIAITTAFKTKYSHEEIDEFLSLLDLNNDGT